MKMSTFGYAAITANRKILGETICNSQYIPTDDDAFLLVEPLRFIRGDVISLTKHDINFLREIPCKFGDNNNVKSASMTNGNDTTSVRTCADYERALKSGFSARTTFDITMESWLKHYCTLLHFISLSRAPLGNHIFGTSFEEISEWPTTMLPKPSDRESAGNLGKIYQAVDFKELRISRAYNRIMITKGDMNYLFVEAARADFSGAGFEEVFIHRYISSSKGTFRFSDCVVLSRESKNAGFTVRNASLNIGS